MDSELLMRLLCMLPGMFAALLWLRPGWREAVRYAMILLPAGGLITLLDTFADIGMAWCFVLLHLLFSGALLVFLLGRYMLKCGWKQSLYAGGVYWFARGICSLLVVPCFLDMSGTLWLALLGALVEVLYIWFFVWLATRHSGISRKVGLLSSAAIVACTTLITVNLGLYAPRLSAWSSLNELNWIMIVYPLFPLACSLLSFALVMRFVHGLSWKRAFAFALLYVALPAMGQVSLILSIHMLT